MSARLLRQPRQLRLLYQPQRSLKMRTMTQDRPTVTQKKKGFSDTTDQNPRRDSAGAGMTIEPLVPLPDRRGETLNPVR